MLGLGNPLMINDVPLFAAPARVDPAAVVNLELSVLEWFRDGYATVLIDLTGTRFCDVKGFTFLARTHGQALSQGGELRAVIPRGGAVFRGFAALNLEHFIPQFSSVDQALASTRESRARVPGSPCCVHGIYTPRAVR
jgi:anti-anti-sigma regulatory factor